MSGDEASTTAITVARYEFKCILAHAAAARQILASVPGVTSAKLQGAANALAAVAEDAEEVIRQHFNNKENK